MMWEACVRKTRQMGGQILNGHRVTGCSFD
jgi:hypothetical protein